MSRPTKTLERVLRGASDASVAFSDLTGLLRALGFDERIRGDHFIYSRADVAEIINIQPVGSKSKPYQVKQVRSIILAYKLGDTL